MTVNAALAARTPGLEKYVGKLCYHVLHVAAQLVHSGRQLHPLRDGKPTQADALRRSEPIKVRRELPASRKSVGSTPNSG